MNTVIGIVTQLIALRKAQRLTQAELAQRAAMTRMTVQRIESTGTDPRLSTVAELAKALGLGLMLLPISPRQKLDGFVASGGKTLGQAAGSSAPVWSVWARMCARPRRWWAKCGSVSLHCYSPHRPPLRATVLARLRGGLALTR